MVKRTSIPVDSDGAFIQCLRPRDGKAHQVAFTDTAARNSTALDSETAAVEVLSSEDCFIAFGGSDVTATNSDHFLAASQARIYSIGGDKKAQTTHISAIRDTTNGTLYISELE